MPIEQSGAAQPAKVGVKYGVYSTPGDHAGKTVAQVRDEVSKLWQVPSDAAAYKGKEKLADSYILNPGEAIEFHYFDLQMVA